MLRAHAAAAAPPATLPPAAAPYSHEEQRPASRVHPPASPGGRFKGSDDWHAATIELEVATWDRWLSLELQRRGIGAAAPATAALRHQLEGICARRKDEARGVHRQQRQREREAAALVVARTEARRGWSGAHEVTPAGGGAGGLLGGGARRGSWGGSGGPSPLAELFGGLTPAEPRCRAEEAAMREAFLRSPDRAGQLEVLSSYAQVALRVPPSRLGSAHAEALWLRLGPTLGKSHTLAVVSAVFAEAWRWVVSCEGAM